MSTLQVIACTPSNQTDQYANLANQAVSETAATLFRTQLVQTHSKAGYCDNTALSEWYDDLKSLGLIRHAVRVVPYSAELKTNISPYCRYFSVKPVTYDITWVKLASTTHTDNQLVVALEQPFYLTGHPILVIDSTVKFVKIRNDATGQILITTGQVSQRHFSDYQVVSDISAEQLTQLAWQCPVSGHPIPAVVDRDRLVATFDDTRATVLSQIYDSLGRQVSVSYGLIKRDDLLDDVVDERFKFQKLDYFQGREARYCNADILKMLEEAGCLVGTTTITREWGFYRYLDKRLYWRQCQVVLLDLAGYREQLGLDQVTEFVISQRHPDPDNIVDIPDTDLQFNQFLTLFNPFSVATKSNYRLETGIWSPLEMYARQLLLRLYQQLRGDTIIAKSHIFGEVTDNLARTVMTRALQGVNSDVAKLGMLSALTGATDYRAAFKRFHNKVVKPLQHNINFFTQYAALLSLDKLTDLPNCQIPLSDFDIWILDESRQLQQSLSVEWPGNIHHPGQLVSEAVTRALELIPAFVKNLSKYYVRYFRPHLKGADGEPQQCRAMLTLAYSLLLTSAAIEPFTGQISSEIRHAITTQIPDISIDTDPLVDVPISTRQAAKNRVAWVIRTVNQVLDFRERERLDIKHPIHSLIIQTPGYGDIDRLCEWQAIIRDETNCLSVEILNHRALIRHLASEEYRHVEGTSFWVNLEWDQACRERYLIRTLISAIQRFRRHVGIKMTDDQDVGVVTDSQVIREVVEQNRWYLSRMLLVDVQVVEPSSVDLDHTQSWQVEHGDQKGGMLPLQIVFLSGGLHHAAQSQTP